MLSDNGTPARKARIAPGPLHATALSPESWPAHRHMEPRRILVVDDDPDVRMLFKVILESGGYQVSEARHGVGALILIRESIPDLVITDMLMPAMDGRELIARLRAETRTADLPILAVSGYPGAIEAVTGADAVLKKPIDRADLLATVESLIERGDRLDQSASA